MFQNISRTVFIFPSSMLPLSETFIYAPAALPVKQLTLASVIYLDFIEGIHSTTGKAVCK